MVNGDDIVADFPVAANKIASITDRDIYVNDSGLISDFDEAADIYCDFRNEDDYTGMENDDYYDEFNKLTEEEQDKLLSDHFEKEHVIVVELCD